MASGKVKLLNIDVQGGKYRLSIEVNNKRSQYDVTVIDRDGLFGVEFPDELGLLLRASPADNKSIVAALKASYRESFLSRRAA